MAPMTNAERQKKYREKLKLNHDQYEEKKIRHREYMRSVRRPVRELPVEQQEKLRLQWKSAYCNKRREKKLNDAVLKIKYEKANNKIQRHRTRSRSPGPSHESDSFQYDIYTKQESLQEPQQDPLEDHSNESQQLDGTNNTTQPDTTNCKKDPMLEALNRQAAASEKQAAALEKLARAQEKLAEAQESQATALSQQAVVLQNLVLSLQANTAAIHALAETIGEAKYRPSHD